VTRNNKAFLRIFNVLTGIHEGFIRDHEGFFNVLPGIYEGFSDVNKILPGFNQFLFVFNQNLQD